MDEEKNIEELEKKKKNLKKKKKNKFCLVAYLS